MLSASGWRESEIYASIAEHFRLTTGLVVPRRPGSGAGARDAFLHLLIFSTLGIWTTELGALAFTLINRWLPDTLYAQYEQFSVELISWSLAGMLIALPIYLLTSWVAAREMAADNGKVQSAIRKWLTYIALLIAALICVSDLICSLAFLFRGEITSRFVAKAAVVLILAGGVFLHYYRGMRKSDSTATPSNSGRWMAVAASAAVLTMAALGFSRLGPPQTQRQFVADDQRVRELYRLSQFVENRWNADAAKLPANLDQFMGTLPEDPVSHARFAYIPGQGSHYQLCANFDRPSLPGPNPGQQDTWVHPSGRFCFLLDATQPPAYPVSHFAR